MPIIRCDAGGQQEWRQFSWRALIVGSGVRIVLWDEPLWWCSQHVLWLCCSFPELVSVGAAPTGDQIAAKSPKLKQIQTVQADIVAEFSEGPGKSVVKMGIRVTADRAAKLTRMEITQHPVFEGEIMILDTKNDRTTVSCPSPGRRSEEDCEHRRTARVRPWDTGSQRASLHGS